MPATRIITGLSATTTLASLLVATVTGEATAHIEDAYDSNYPVSYDPATGVLIISEEN
jgi:hypothetical protein